MIILIFVLSPDCIATSQEYSTKNRKTVVRWPKKIGHYSPLRALQTPLTLSSSALIADHGLSRQLRRSTEDHGDQRRRDRRAGIASAGSGSCFHQSVWGSCLRAWFVRSLPFSFPSDYLNSLNLRIILDLERFRVDIDLENLSFMDVELRLRELPYTNSPHAISCVLVASFFREKSAVSHSITWIHALAVKRVEIEGATAYAVSGLLNYSHFPLLSGLSKRFSWALS